MRQRFITYYSSIFIVILVLFTACSTTPNKLDIGALTLSHSTLVVADQLLQAREAEQIEDCDTGECLDLLKEKYDGRYRLVNLAMQAHNDRILYLSVKDGDRGAVVQVLLLKYTAEIIGMLREEGLFEKYLWLTGESS